MGKVFTTLISSQAKGRRVDGRTGYVREANNGIGSICKSEPCFCSSEQDSKSTAPLNLYLACFCGQEGPGMLGYFLGVSKGILEPVLASTRMVTATSPDLFWTSPCSLAVAFSTLETSTVSEGMPLGLYNTDAFYYPLGLKNDTQLIWITMGKTIFIQQ